MNKDPQYNQQCKSEVEEICIYQNMKVAVTASISENELWVPYQKESQAPISASIHIQWSFIKQKLDLFGLGFTSLSLHQIDANGWVALALSC